MRLPVIPVKGDKKWELLSKIVDKLETKKALARNKITPVNKEQNNNSGNVFRIGDILHR